MQIAQFRKATAISEALLVEEDVKAVLSGLLRAADKIAADKLEELKGVFKLANVLESDLEDRLRAIAPDVEAALSRVLDAATAFVTRSAPETDYYFRAQIIENAKHCSAPGSLDTSLSHAAGLIEIAACHA